jgi:hypothetical protein
MEMETHPWDEAEDHLRLQGWARPERRHHAPSGRNGCAPRDAEQCPSCAANVRARDAFRKALFAEMACLRGTQART